MLWFEEKKNDSHPYLLSTQYVLLKKCIKKRLKEKPQTVYNLSNYVNAHKTGI